MRKHKGFTLVELVVVVMILGILAAVAAPKLLGTSSSAADNGVKQTLAVVRDAIERYAAEHGGALPGADGAQATLKTDLAPYLRGKFPICPVGPWDPKNDDVKMTPTVGLDIAGTNTAEAWHYSTDNGKFIINSTAPTKSVPSVNYDEL
jgi:prepilin-type N-terminal cleavage/methylation domain-containing protein